MNKYQFLLISSLYLIVVTFIVNSTEAYEMGGGVASSLGTVDSVGLDALWGFVQTYFNLLTFQIDNFPIALSLIFFHPIALAHGFMLIDVVKDMIPFT